jgi:hypothetical protein
MSNCPSQGETKLVVDARGDQGVQVRDHNGQVNQFIQTCVAKQFFEALALRWGESGDGHFRHAGHPRRSPDG